MTLFASLSSRQGKARVSVLEDIRGKLVSGDAYYRGADGPAWEKSSCQFRAKVTDSTHCYSSLDFRILLNLSRFFQRYLLEPN